MLLKLSEGCRVPPRFPSFEGGVKTGHKVSAVYFIGHCKAGTATIPGKGSSFSEDTNPDTDMGTGGELKLLNIEGDPNLQNIEVDSKPTGGGGQLPELSPPPAGNERGADKNGTCLVSTLSSAKTETSVPGRFVRQHTVVKPLADRLVLLRSDLVSTQTLEMRGPGQQQYVVLFWIHRAKDEAKPP